MAKPTTKNVEAQAAELRGRIPQPIIGHYDRLRVRGKKGVAVVRNQVCTGCHMHVPIGQITVLMRGEDIQLCESCGRYLYLPDPAEAEVLSSRGGGEACGEAGGQAPETPGVGARGLRRLRRSGLEGTS